MGASGPGSDGLGDAGAGWGLERFERGLMAEARRRFGRQAIRIHSEQVEVHLGLGGLHRTTRGC